MTRINPPSSYPPSGLPSYNVEGGVLISSGATLLYFDNFTGSDGTLLTAHTPDYSSIGASYVANAVSLKIVSNKADYNTTGGTNGNYINIGQSDMTIWISGAGNDGAALSLFGRTNSVPGGAFTDGIYVALGRATATTLSYNIYERVGGSPVSKVSGTITVGSAANYSLYLGMVNAGDITTITIYNESRVVADSGAATWTQTGTNAASTTTNSYIQFANGTAGPVDAIAVYDNGDISTIPAVFPS